MEGKDINLIHALNIDVNGDLSVEIINPVFQSNLNNINANATAQVLQILQISHARLQNQGVNVLACITDNGNMNPTRDNITLFTPSIPCSMHEICNILNKLFDDEIFYLNGRGVQLAVLRNIFDHHVNVQTDVILKNFWNTLRAFKKASREKMFALLQGFTKIDLMSVFSLMRNIQWDAIQVPRLPQLERFIVLMLNLQKTCQIIGLRMSAVNEQELRILADFFLRETRFNPLVLNDSFSRLSTCLLFYANTFQANPYRFIPQQLSIAISYIIKEYFRYVMKNNLLPNLQDFITTLGEMHDNGKIIEEGFSQYFSMRLVITPTAFPLRDLFLRHFSIPINANALIRVQNNSLRYFPSLVNVGINDIEIAMAILEQARGQRIVNSPFVLQHERLIDDVIKIKQSENAYRFK